MDKVSGRLTVFFEEPFWIGVFERISEGKLSVCKVTFGAEPKDCYGLLLRFRVFEKLILQGFGSAKMALAIPLYLYH